MSLTPFLDKKLPDYTISELVAIYRQYSASTRTIERNLRLDRYQGRNSGITVQTFRDNTRIRHAVEIELVHRGERERRLVGWLVAEHNLALRISEGRDNGDQRPELRERLNDARRDIRTVLADN